MICIRSSFLFILKECRLTFTSNYCFLLVFKKTKTKNKDKVASFSEQIRRLLRISSRMKRLRVFGLLPSGREALTSRLKTDILAATHVVGMGTNLPTHAHTHTWSEYKLPLFSFTFEQTPTLSRPNSCGLITSGLCHYVFSSFLNR